jgi:TPR repeat protein
VDFAKAREWYEKDAAKGDVDGMNLLGRLYQDGRFGAQDYGKAREWYEKAAAKGETQAMNSLGLLYTNGYGVTKDYGKAREWYEKAAAKGNAEAVTNLEKLRIIEAGGNGQCAEALRLMEVLAAKTEAAEMKSDGKPGPETANALNHVAWCALFVRDFTKALTATDRASALLPDDLTIETNRTHALLFLGRGKAAKAVYLAHKGKPVTGQDGKLWERVIVEDFAEFRKAGLTHPMMAEIEKELGVDSSMILTKPQQ